MKQKSRLLLLKQPEVEKRMSKNGYRKGRPKGSKNKPGKETLDIHKSPKQWKKSSLKSSLDQDKVDYYLYNDLDITELYDEMKLYDYGWKNNRRTYNLNSEAKKRKDGEGM